jgi:hypothetical protein
MPSTLILIPGFSQNLDLEGSGASRYVETVAETQEHRNSQYANDFTLLLLPSDVRWICVGEDQG